jgi:hypothetical protein
MSYLKEGKLTKRGTGYPYTWRERQFALTHTALTYATVDGVGRGSFAINKSTVVTSLSQADMPGKKSPFGFKLSTGVDDLYIFASSDEDRAEWIEAIVGALANTSDSAKVVSPTHHSERPRSAAKTPPHGHSESRLVDLAHRIIDQNASTSDKRLRRAADRENARIAATKKEATLVAEENAEALSLAKLLADVKISEDTVRLTDLKKAKKKVEALIAALGPASTPAVKAVADGEAESFAAEWSKLGSKAAEFAEKHADAEHAHAVAAAKAKKAADAADAAEERARKLRAEATQLGYDAAAAKLGLDAAGMLANALWTREFRAEIEEKMSKRSPPPPVSSATAPSSPAAPTRRGMGQPSSSFMKIIAGTDDDDCAIDVERRRKVDKKLGSDTSFNERYIWINEETGCFHWSKSDRAGNSSKFVHIKTCCKTVLLCRPPKGASWIGFSLQFKPDLDSSAFAGAKGVSSKSECIDVKVVGDDATQYVETICRKIIAIIRPKTK